MAISTSGARALRRNAFWKGARRSGLPKPSPLGALQYVSMNRIALLARFVMRCHSGSVFHGPGVVDAMRLAALPRRSEVVNVYLRTYR